MSPALAGLIACTLVMTGAAPGVAVARRVLLEDRRVVADRLNPGSNPGRRDESFLNAVGAVWPFHLVKTGSSYAASTGERAASGFLIDACHVLTSLHVAYGDADVLDPPLGQAVAFAVGQTSSDHDRGALQGLKFLASGRVIAHGDALVLDGRVHHPDDDWALMRLDNPVEDIEPMQIGVVDLADLPAHRELWSAGYPSDHRRGRADGFKLKDLWISQGEVVGTLGADGGLLLESTLQTTPGNSGGPVYIQSVGTRPLVVGMVQSSRGNGIDRPNVQLLFTPGLMARIAAARRQTACGVAAAVPVSSPKR